MSKDDMYYGKKIKREQEYIKLVWAPLKFKKGSQ